MKGLVENTLKLTDAERRIKQPKYFHTDEEILVRDWYRAAYPTDTWGAERIDPTLKFSELRPVLEYIREDVVIGCIKRLTGDFAGHIMSFSDSVVENRIYKELNVNEGLSFGYIMEA